MPWPPTWGPPAPWEEYWGSPNPERWGEQRALVVAPEGSEAPQVLPNPRWSPRGDWVACGLSNGLSTWLALVAPDAPEPVSSFDLLGVFAGREAPQLQFDWSADGFYLAALTVNPHLEQRPATLYLAEKMDYCPSILDYITYYYYRHFFYYPYL